MVCLKRMINKMLLLILATMLNSSSYAMEAEKEIEPNHFSRLPKKLADRVISFVSSKKIGQDSSMVNDQAEKDPNSVNMWQYLCESEGWISKPTNFTWKQYFSDQHKKNTRIVRLSVVQEIVPNITGIERIEVKFNGRTYTCPYTYHPDERPQDAEVMEVKGKTCVRTLLAEEVMLYRSEFQNPVPYIYTIYSIYEEESPEGETEQLAWQDLKNIKVGEVTEAYIFDNPNGQIISLRLNLPQDLGKGSVVPGYQAKPK